MMNLLLIFLLIFILLVIFILGFFGILGFVIGFLRVFKKSKRRKKNIMDWKQFLKPDWRKIVIIILIIFFLFLGRLIEIPIKIENFLGSFFLFLISPILLFSSCATIGGQISLFCQISTLVGFIILPIFWYLLSCLIVWIYDKYRKKKK